MRENEELWDREQIRDFLGLSSINSVYPWISRNGVEPAAFGEPEGGRVKYLYSAATIREVAASLPGKGNRTPRNTEAVTRFTHLDYDLSEENLRGAWE